MSSEPNHESLLSNPDFWASPVNSYTNTPPTDPEELLALAKKILTTSHSLVPDPLDWCYWCDGPSRGLVWCPEHGGPFPRLFEGQS